MAVVGGWRWDSPVGTTVSSRSSAGPESLPTIASEAGVRDALPPNFAEFLTVQRFVILATCDAERRPWCSMVAGWPGFASAPEPTRVLLDRRAFGDEDVLRHLGTDPRIGMLALDPSTRRRIRVNGTASIGAEAVTISVVETFGNCRQYIQQRPPGGPEPGEVDDGFEKRRTRAEAT